MKRRAKARPSVLPWLVGAVLLSGVSLAAAEERHQACLRPSGGDDTAVLQQALEGCSGAKHHCTVTLCEGTFHTGILRVRRFRGTLRGAGGDRTVLRALPELHVSEDLHDFFRVDPFEPGQAWPYLVQFFEGEGSVEDLGILVPAPPAGSNPTTGWYLLDDGPIYELRGGILVTGRDDVDFVVSEVRVAAEDPGTELGTTVFNGAEYGGLLFNPDDTSDFPVFPASGRFEVERSTFDNVLTGTSLGELAAARVLVSRNQYRSTVAVEVIDADRSGISVVDNQWTVSYRGVQIRQNLDGAPSRASRLVVTANRGTLRPFLPGLGDGLDFLDPAGDASPEPGGTSLRVLGNSWTVGAGGAPAASGITVNGAAPLQIAANRLAGRAAAGISVDTTEGCGVWGNSMQQLDTAGGPDVLLGSAASDCVATVAPGDLVVDHGSANQVTRQDVSAKQLMRHLRH
jgi:hypothetical protein